MSNQVLPSLPGLSWNTKKKPIFKTTIREASSGREYRGTSWSTPRWEYVLSYEFLRQGMGRTELTQILGFFNKHRGAWDSWLYQDPDDNTVTLQQFATGDGTTVTFQLVRDLGGFLEPVYDLNGAPSVYVNGTLTSVTVGALGMVTFDSAPAAGALLKWTGSYYWRCRFSDDYIEPSKFMKDLFDLRQMKFITVKP
jgi:uncharacterized protein (TIGR02217 family)